MGETKLKRDLWENVRALMIKEWGEENVSKLATVAKIGGSASRIKKQKTAVGLDVLLKVARVFHVPAHHLVTPPDERALLQDEFLLEIARTYLSTDDEGRRTIATASTIAKARIDGRTAGLGKPSKTYDR